MFHELEVMNYNYNDWVQMAVSDRTFHHIKKVDDNTCRVYDQDDICIYTVKMPYEELVARLNGQEVPKKPEPVEIECWAVIHKKADFIRPYKTKAEANDFWMSLIHVDDYEVIPLKGIYTRG